jgi:NADPH2 dehydrogenase
VSDLTLPQTIGGIHMSKLFSPIKLRELEVKNRIVMAPMCMYSAKEDGVVSDFHKLHYATRAMGGVGLIITEAVAVEKRGRICSQDLGIWDDKQIDGLRELVELCRENDARIGIQLAHAGRKCCAEQEQPIGPSAIGFSEEYKTPVEMNHQDIKEVVEAFRIAAERADKAGFDIIELHGAHGYLINQFLSRLTNKRLDEYGGTLENRARFLKEIVIAVREVWSEEKPLMIRFSAEEFEDKGNHPDDIAKIINLIKEVGIDLINVSSGGVVPNKPSVYPGYQLEYANEVNYKTGLPVVGGGLIKSPLMCEEIIQNNRADMVYLGRELLRNPYWALNAAKELGAEIKWPEQYERAK